MRAFFAIVVALAAAFLLPTDVRAQSNPCPKNYWWDGTKCHLCTWDSCDVGFYRESCAAGSTQDAQCLPCGSPAPANAVFVNLTTFGMGDHSETCYWECLPGYYRTNPDVTFQPAACEPCSTVACDAPFTRQQCTEQGRVQDAGCDCGADHYISTDADTGVQSCVQCQEPVCRYPGEQEILRCPGNTQFDIARCLERVIYN